uniref:CX domain-containing protein n=1 Tax=Arion vulgaris TaxID=1028688 RepID=A0A0B6ZM50_9EUPU
MAKLLISFIFVLLHGVSVTGDFCTYKVYPYTYNSYKYCSTGCCYTYTDPCCIQLVTETAAFIVPMVLGSVFLVVCAIVVIIIRRRRRLQTTIQYGTTVATPQVVTTTTAGNYYQGGYNNPQFPPGNAYSGQPPNGQMIQTYPAQTGMYQANPSNQGPQMYAGAPPMYTAGAPIDPATSQSKH